MKFCLFRHKFWSDIEIKFGHQHEVWDTLRFRVCTRCGKVKAFVEGNDDNGSFRAINSKKVRLFEEVRAYK